MTETPSQEIVKKANTTITFATPDGRPIVLKKLSPTDRINLYKIAGKAQDNAGYFSYLQMAYHVVSIDGEPVHKGSALQLEAIIQRLGDDADFVALQMAQLYTDVISPEDLQDLLKNA